MKNSPSQRNRDYQEIKPRLLISRSFPQLHLSLQSSDGQITVKTAMTIIRRNNTLTLTHHFVTPFPNESQPPSFTQSYQPITRTMTNQNKKIDVY